MGGHVASDFTSADLVIVNPAVPRPWANPFVLAARDAGVPVSTEISLLCERLPDPSGVIAITGSVGKSTTSAMIQHILRACGERAVFGGNIGSSLLASLGRDIVPGTFVVLEVSSAMLYWLGERRWSAHAAVVTNCVANHVDWHGSVEHYSACKRQILAHQNPGDVAILGDGVGDWATRDGVRRVVLNHGAEVTDLCVPGGHNRANAALAVESVLALCPWITRANAERSARGFSGLRHRLQRVGVFGGIECFNDSKSTTPESALRALDALGERAGISRVHLIAGGYDKGIDLSAVGRRAGELAGLYTIGATGAALASSAGGRARECGTLDRAVAQARARACEGDVLLLSPACASWDQFDNFERRGEEFERLVREVGP
jgi:UDP-N-acetylmuramoylalanine--D-glutamate ligase